MSGTDEDRDARAGEYALGLGSRAERRAAEREAVADPAFARRIAGWERLLAPLLLAFTPVPPPPELWARIERSIAGGRPSAGRRGWAAPLAAGIGGFALAAGLAAVAVLGRPEPVPVAVLHPTSGGAPELVAFRAAGGATVVRALAPLAVPAGHDLELWLLAPGAVRPTPLGLLRHGVARLGSIGAGRLLVSLEAEGGSRTGLPGGPVEWATP